MLSAALILGVPFVGLVVGLWLARSGVRGIAIDDHPCCAWCGYDLVNAGTAARCPECGVQSEVMRRIGNRARRPRRIALGLGLACVCGPVFFTAAYRAASPASDRALVPLWALRAEARSGSTAAIDEIARRVGSNRLSAATVAVVVDEALERRHAEDLWLRVAWGDVVDAGLGTGKLDEARVARSVEEAVGVRWSRMERHVLWFGFEPAVGSQSSIGFDAEIESARLEDGTELGVTPVRSAVRYSHVLNPAPGEWWVYVELPPQAPGKRMIVRWRVRVSDAATGTPLGADWVHTEAIEIPADGNADLSGFRVRESKGTGRSGR